MSTWLKVIAFFTLPGFVATRLSDQPDARVLLMCMIGFGLLWFFIKTEEK